MCIEIYIFFCEFLCFHVIHKNVSYSHKENVYTVYVWCVLALYVRECEIKKYFYGNFEAVSSFRSVFTTVHVT
jgi:hypothetical protein